MKKKTLLRIFPLLALVVMIASGCSEYTRLMKTGTSMEKYEAGKAYLNNKKNQKAIEIFEMIRPMFMGLPQEDSIVYFTGLAYYRSRNYEMSGAMFDEFRKTFGRSGLLEDAEFLYADGLYRSSPPANRDQSHTIRALIAIDEYIERYPRSEHRDEMRAQMEGLTDKLKEKAYLNAKVYYTIGEWKAATVALRNALDEYPDTDHREEMLYLIVKSHYLYASNSLDKLQRERYLNMQGAYYNFVAEYSESQYSKEVEKMIADARKYLAKFSEINNTSISNTENGI